MPAVGPADRRGRPPDMPAHRLLDDRSRVCPSLGGRGPTAAPLSTVDVSAGIASVVSPRRGGEAARPPSLGVERSRCGQATDATDRLGAKAMVVRGDRTPPVGPRCDVRGREASGPRRGRSGPPLVAHGRPLRSTTLRSVRDRHAVSVRGSARRPLARPPSAIGAGSTRRWRRVHRRSMIDRAVDLGMGPRRRRDDAAPPGGPRRSRPTGSPLGPPSDWTGRAPAMRAGVDDP